MTSIRPAAAADLPAVRAIADEYDLLDTWRPGPDFLDLERETGRLLVAEGAAGVLGFTGTLTRGSLTHLGDLFIDPRTQSSGLGRRLLEAVLPAPGQRVVTFASADPRALALYLRRGLRPGAPVWYLAASSPTPPTPATPLVPATVDEVVALDADTSGGERRRHLSWFAARPGVGVWTTPGGYAFTRVHDGTCLIGPAGGVDPEASTRAVLAAVGHAATAGLAARLAAFGPHPVVRSLLDAGFHLVDKDTFMTTHPAPFDVERYLPHPDLG